MNNVKYWREKNNMTQADLAQKSGVSIRTVQRIETGSVLKGFTLKAIAEVLGVSPSDLLKNDTQDTERAKVINLSVLLGVIIPFGGVIFPYILTAKTGDSHNKSIGKKLVELQLTVTVLLSIFLILSPFVQQEFRTQKPIFIYVLIAFFFIKLTTVVANGISLNKNGSQRIAMKNSFL